MVSRPRFSVVLIGSAVCAIGLASSAAAQSTPTFALTVTEPLELIESVGTTRRIGRAEIEARNARSLDEALRLIPGIYIRTGGDGTPRVDDRGFRSRHLLLLVKIRPASRRRRSAKSR
jgi:vitamin B12 transporter